MVAFSLCESQGFGVRGCKQTQEVWHPETKNAATGNGRKKVRKVREAKADRFTKSTAMATYLDKGAQVSEGCSAAPPLSGGQNARQTKEALNKPVRWRRWVFSCN